MNVSFLINSLKHFQEFKLVSQLSRWIYAELTLIKYSDYKLLESLEKKDIDITESIIHLNRSKKMLEYYILNEENPCNKLYGCNCEIKIPLLLKHGVDISDFYDGISILLWAAENDHSIIAALLIDEYGVDLHYNDDEVLRKASWFNSIKTTKVLLERGANVKAKNYRSILISYRRGHLDIVRLLLEYCSKTCENNYPEVLKNELLEIISLLILNGT